MEKKYKVAIEKIESKLEASLDKQAELYDEVVLKWKTFHLDQSMYANSFRLIANKQ